MQRAIGAESDRLVQGAHRGLGAHGHRDDLVDGGLASLADLHRGLDPVGVERVQVLLAAAIEPLGVRVDPLLDSGVRNLLYQTANLQLGPSFAPGEWAGTGSSFPPAGACVGSAGGGMLSSRTRV